MWNCTHFRRPTDEQLRHVDIFFVNYYNLQSDHFKLKTMESRKICNFICRRPTDEQLRHVDIFFGNYYNLQSEHFELKTMES